MGLKFSRSKSYSGGNSRDHFLITYDYAAGRRDRYTVFRWRAGNSAMIIGRELTLAHAKRICDT